MPWQATMSPLPQASSHSEEWYMVDAVGHCTDCPFPNRPRDPSGHFVLEIPLSWAQIWANMEVEDTLLQHHLVPEAPRHTMLGLSHHLSPAPCPNAGASSRAVAGHTASLPCLLHVTSSPPPPGTVPAPDSTSKTPKSFPITAHKVRHPVDVPVPVDLAVGPPFPAGRCGAVSGTSVPWGILSWDHAPWAASNPARGCCITPWSAMLPSLASPPCPHGHSAGEHRQACSAAGTTPPLGKH